MSHIIFNLILEWDEIETCILLVAAIRILILFGWGLREEEDPP